MKISAILILVIVLRASLAAKTAQECFAHFGLLDATDGSENPDLTKNDNADIGNVCEPDVENGEQIYNFIVSYDNDYWHDPECDTQGISFGPKTLSEGNDRFDQWSYDSGSKEISFSVKHDDLENVYGCIKLDNADEYIWQCYMNLHIYYLGTEQLTYAFHMTTTLNKTKTNSVTVSVTKNEVEGDCCTNSLSINTTLQFCEDMSCSKYLSDNQTVERKADIFVEHSITSDEFKYYYLHGKQLRLGAFVPEILDEDGSNAASLIYKFKSNVAMENMVIEAISQIALTAQGSNNRRMLPSDVDADGNPNSDYNVKGQNSITVKEKASATILAFAFYGLALFALMM